MALTKEERAQRMKDRQRERQERAERFPCAEIAATDEHRGVKVVLQQGDDLWIDIWRRGRWMPASIIPWEIMSICLADAGELARFIRALVARYNAMAERINADVADCEMVPITAAGRRAK